MKKFHVIFVLTTLTLGLARASTGWVRTYGGDSTDLGLCVQQTLDGGYILLGSTPSFGSGAWLIKTDAFGDSVWTQLYKDFSPRWLSITSDGGYIITGSDFNHYVSLIKADQEGNIFWSRSWDEYEIGDESRRALGQGNYVEETSDGGYILTGWIHATIFPEESQLLLLKTNDQGDALWVHLYASYDFGDYTQGVGNCVRETSDGGYIICGHTAGIGGVIPDVWLIKTDALGDSVWTKWYGDGRDDIGYSVQQTGDGGYIVCGETGGGTFSGDLQLIKTDADGNIEWDRSYGIEGLDEGRWVQQTTDNGYIITGYTESTANGEPDLWLLKTDEQGDTIWSREYGCDSADMGCCVQETEDGGYIIIGTTNRNGLYSLNTGDIYLIKTHADGDTLGVWEQPVVGAGLTWYLTPIGRRIVLRYEDRPLGFRASVFNASGRKVDELHSTLQSGTIYWGQGFSPGVYFIKEATGSPGATRKVVLIK